MKLMIPTTCALILSACASTPPVPPVSATPVTTTAIGRAEVEAAQRSWCDALVSIAAESARGGDARALADRVLSAAYNYDRGTVLFKPTLTHGEHTFRMDRRGALAYFIGGDPAYPDDAGFARKPWTACRAEVAGIYATNDQAIAMGNVHFTDQSGNQVKVDKTFGYVRAADGTLRIVLHHSSLPYQPADPSRTVDK